MTKQERQELVDDIEQRLEDELEFELEYEIDDYHENGTSIVDVDIDTSNTEDWPDNWDEQVEDVISEVVGDWGGWYSWDGWCISVSISDDDD